jgi:hypothetical protein
VNIPVYLGSDWDNVPLHLPNIFKPGRELMHNPNVRVAMLPPGSLTSRWEGLHYEALALYDRWLKGRDTGIMEGQRSGTSCRNPTTGEVTQRSRRLTGG